MSLNQNLSIFLIVLHVFNLRSFVFGQCLLRLSEEPTLRPKVFQYIGSQKIELQIYKTDTEVYLFEDQKIELQCNTAFENPYHTKNSIVISSCSSLWHRNEIYACSKQQWNLYETLKKFIWCPKNTTSYLLARPTRLEALQYQYLAGVCYDTHNFNFKSLFYTIYSIYSKNLHPSVLSDFYAPKLELKHFKDTFANKMILESDYGNQDFSDWIKFAKYNYSSIVQNTLLLNDYNEQMGSLLNLAWWPSLRLGNWKRYETALRSHVENEEKPYDILAGVSRVASAPIIQPCQTNFTMKYLLNDRNNEIPLYIWNYLRSATNKSDEMVIIGVNTPFYEFYSEKDIIFCEDKCRDIPWLKKVSSTFRYSAMGVIFCCSSEDVKLSRRLDGFPDVDFETEPVISETVPVISNIVTVNPISEEAED